MFSLRCTTVKALFVTVSALLLLCLQCHAVKGQGARHLYTGEDSVDGGGGPWVSLRTQRTLAEEVGEDDAAASLRDSVVQAVKYTRSNRLGHATRLRSLEDLVTPTQLTFLNLAHLYLPSLTNVSQECRRDLTALYLSLADMYTLIENGTLWPLKLIDSWGKFSDGMFAGNLQQIGFFKQCLDIKVYQPAQTFDHPYQRQNPSQQPPIAHSKPPNLLSKSQNANSYLLKDPVRHQALPSQVYEALNLPHRPLTVSSQPFLDPEEPPRLHEDSHPVLSHLPRHPRNPPQDGPLRRYIDLLDDSTTTTTTTPPPLADFSGQYCLVIYESDNDNEESQEFPSVNLRTPGISSSMPVALGFMAYGTCIPSTCTREEIQASVEAELLEEGLRVAAVECQVQGHRHPLGAAEVTGIVIVSLLVALMLLGALADLFTSAPSRQHLREGPLRYLLAFSVTTNLQKMFHLETRKLPGVIPSINGIRFITITWVVLGHQYAYTAMYVSENVAEIPELVKPVYAQMITNADKSVDTFFLLSGLLVTIGLLGMVKRLGRFNLPLYLFHRLLRLWPPVALCTMLVATLAGLAVSGPYAEQYWSSVVKGCRHSWWSDVTLTNNLVFRYLEQMEKEGEAACCLPHTWYLGVDTQLYLLMPLLLLPLTWWPRRGWAWLLLWTAASVIIPGAIIGAYDLWPTTLLVNDMSASLEFSQKVYTMPWCRAGPYLVGAWAGYLLHHSRNDPSITRLKPWQVCLGWLAAVGIALAVLFGIAPYNYFGTASEVPQMSTAEAVVYGGAHRAAWGVAVAWVIVACTWGYGGPVAWILEHPIWQPFSRLSYCIYLTSMPIQFMIFYSTKRPSYYSYYGKLQETAGVLVVTACAALFVSLASESPTLRLEKMLLQRSTEPRPAAPPSEDTTSPPSETGQGHENGHQSLLIE